MSTWRELCRELIDSRGPDYYRALERARAALAQPEPEAAGPTDDELLELYPATMVDEEDAFAFARAVLARWGSPNLGVIRRSLGEPVEGEVAELVAELRRICFDVAPSDADTITRAAALLEQLSAQAPQPPPSMPPGGSLRSLPIRVVEPAAAFAALDAAPEGKPSDQELADPFAQCYLDSSALRGTSYLSGLRPTAPACVELLAPVPVAVSERLPGPEDCVTNPRTGQGQWCWGWTEHDSMPCSGRVPYSGRWRMMRHEWLVDEATHWLPAHALPIPSGEVES